MRDRNFVLCATLCLAIFTSTPLNSSATILTTNGGFETGDFTGWTQAGTGVNAVLSGGADTGTFYANVNNTAPASNASLAQVAIGAGQVAMGQPITISFAVRGTTAVGGIAGAQILALNGGGGVTFTNVLSGNLPLDSNPLTWKSFDFMYTPTTNVDGGVTLQLNATTGGAPGSTASIDWDSVSVSVIPEPATFALLGLAGVALVGCRRKRRV